jgi:hypothetical protein
VYKGVLIDDEGWVESIICTAEYNRKFLLTQKENLYSVLICESCVGYRDEL